LNGYLSLREQCDEKDLLTLMSHFSVVINPNFKHYEELKSSFSASYVNNLFIEDAKRLEHNNRQYMTNFAKQNETAEFLADYLHCHTADPNTTLACVYYPKVCWSRDNYRARMRPATKDFVPGYGGVLAITFETVAAASAFFDNLSLFKGPSFGANITISIPYVQLVMQNAKKWAASHGLDETLVRISVGLEDKEALLGCIKVALNAADSTKVAACETI
jgi:cystathionine gamma-synthase